MIRKKSWEEFRSTGLVLFINQILHVFGWCIVFNIIDGKVVDCFPARTRFRGFSNQDVSESYGQITSYLKENMEELEKESKE